MSLPVYLLLCDEDEMQVPGDCSSLGREGAIEIMSSSYGVRQPVDSNIGSMTGCRQHSPVIVHKQLDKVSPYLAVAVCEGKRLQKAITRYYEAVEAGIEVEIYNINLGDVVVSSIDLTHVHYPDSSSPNMHKVVGFGFHDIEWNYVRGNIKHNDAWIKSVKREQRQ